MGSTPGASRVWFEGRAGRRVGLYRWLGPKGPVSARRPTASAPPNVVGHGCTSQAGDGGPRPAANPVQPSHGGGVGYPPSVSRKTGVSARAPKIFSAGFAPARGVSALDSNVSNARRLCGGRTVDPRVASGLWRRRRYLRLWLGLGQCEDHFSGLVAVALNLDSPLAPTSHPVEFRVDSAQMGLAGHSRRG